jgi:tetratricopeptide (TPR) repeat protein
MKALIRPLILAASLVSAGIVAAAETPSAPERPRDPVLEKVSAATSQKDWAGAQGILKEALQSNPGNADYHNLYAYSIRKGADPDMNLVFKHYNEALRIDPRHRGAHEYIGEAYLIAGNVAKAKEHLGVLDKLCFFPCEEYTDLKKAIAEYEKKQVAR